MGLNRMVLVKAIAWPPIMVLTFMLGVYGVVWLLETFGPWGVIVPIFLAIWIYWSAWLYCERRLK